MGRRGGGEEKGRMRQKMRRRRRRRTGGTTTTTTTTAAAAAAAATFQLYQKFLKNMTFISYMTKNMCMAMYSEYLYILLNLCIPQ